MIPLRDTLPSRNRPVVTSLLIAINVMVFLFEISLDDWTRNEVVHIFGAVPSRLWLPSLVTSMFLHGGWFHLIFNMWFLWIFGDNVEDILGRGLYLAFYLTCGVAAAAAQIAFSPDSRVPLIGASGAIAGVMGAYLVKFPRAQILTLVPIFVFFTTFEVPAWVMLLYWFGLQVLSGAMGLASVEVSQGGVAWWAHIGGFLAGMILISVLPTAERYRRRADLRW